MGPQQSKKESAPNTIRFFPFTQAQYIKNHAGPVTCMELLDGNLFLHSFNHLFFFIPDLSSRFVSGSDDKTIMINSYEAAQTLYLLEGHKQSITCLYLLNDDSFASGSLDGTIIVCFASLIDHIVLSYCLDMAIT